MELRRKHRLERIHFQVETKLFPPITRDAKINPISCEDMYGLTFSSREKVKRLFIKVIIIRALRHKISNRLRHRWSRSANV